MFKRQKTLSNTQIEEIFNDKSTGFKSNEEVEEAVAFLNNFLNQLFFGLKVIIVTCAFSASAILFYLINLIGSRSQYFQYFF